ncbi:hypothetical protein WUBG_15857 [Wuchereria bancrofti]|uniref:Uncharacterized protein n=1 Tax=Wuchereria bancrofti TaxID=6293 RepID=J9DUA2_WUCBA|nr:hypothetical protein WUBG_15857 [Wuchereria bancrofti]
MAPGNVGRDDPDLILFTFRSIQLRIAEISLQNQQLQTKILKLQLCLLKNKLARPCNTGNGNGNTEQNRNLDDAIQSIVHEMSEISKVMKITVRELASENAAAAANFV